MYRPFRYLPEFNTDIYKIRDIHIEVEVGRGEGAGVESRESRRGETHTEVRRL